MVKVVEIVADEYCANLIIVVFRGWYVASLDSVIWIFLNVFSSYE